MLHMLRQRKVARVLFEESHGEAWSIRPEVAAAVQPEHASGSSYALAAAALAERDFEVAAFTAGPLSADVLATAEVLVIAHPSAARWGRTVGGSPILSGAEIDAIETFVAGGGGLVVLGESEQDKYGANLNELLARFGLAIDNRTVEDHGRHNGTPTWVFGEPDPGTSEAALLHLVGAVCFHGAGALLTERDGAVVLRAADTAHPAGAGLLAAVRHGEGRVVVAADSDLFGDDAFGEFDHRRLWLNLFFWVALPAFCAAPEAIESAAARDVAWERLRDETDALRALQEPRGEVDLTRHDAAEVRARVAAMIEAVSALEPLLSPPASLSRPGRGRSAALARRRLRQARLRRLARRLSARTRPPRRDRAPRRVSLVHAQRLAGHALRGAHRAHPLARVRRPA